ncbi:MAG: 2-C-methyl-D-erythritol 4-phosphate cytidylyltransferase [Lachnospiraceae bacterium]
MKKFRKKKILKPKIYRACITGRTFKTDDKDIGMLMDEKNKNTPDRRYRLESRHTRHFQTALIREAYEKLMQQPADGITDDAMVEQSVLKYPDAVKGNFIANLKITTPEDLPMAQILVDNLMKKQHTEKSRFF